MDHWDSRGEDVTRHILDRGRDRRHYFMHRPPKMLFNGYAVHFGEPMVDAPIPQLAV
jgi:hypothetical protein